MLDKRGASGGATLVTGFPLFTARRMALKVLEQTVDQKLYLLVPGDQRAMADGFRAGLPAETRGRVDVLTGDVASMDLGLSGHEYKTLQTEVETIHHMAGLYHIGSSREDVERINVTGTRCTLELALECERLRRYCFGALCTWLAIGKAW